MGISAPRREQQAGDRCGLVPLGPVGGAPDKVQVGVPEPAGQVTGQVGVEVGVGGAGHYAFTVMPRVPSALASV
jgi:hypothetical protein